MWGLQFLSSFVNIIHSFTKQISPLCHISIQILDIQSINLCGKFPMSICLSRNLIFGLCFFLNGSFLTIQEKRSLSYQNWVSQIRSSSQYRHRPNGCIHEMTLRAELFRSSHQIGILWTNFALSHPLKPYKGSFSFIFVSLRTVFFVCFICLELGVCQSHSDGWPLFIFQKPEIVEIPFLLTLAVNATGLLKSNVRKIFQFVLIFIFS